MAPSFAANLPPAGTRLKKHASHGTLSKALSHALTVSPLDAAQHIHAKGNDLELLSVGQYRHLANADLVISDRGLNPNILEIVHGDLLILSQLKHGRAAVPDYVLAAVQKAEEAGKKVVRITVDESEVVSDQVDFKPDSPATLVSRVSTPASEVDVEEEDLETHQHHHHHQRETFKLPKAAISTTTVTKKSAVSTFVPTPLLTTGHETTSKIAYALSDMSFVYPVTPAFPPREILTSLSNSNTPNVTGVPTDVRVLSTSSGAGAIVHGAASGGVKASIVMHAGAVREMIPTLSQISGSNTGVVLHVEAEQVDRQGRIVGSAVGDVVNVARVASDAVVVASGTVQECHDVALISHAVAEVAKVPVVHFFGGEVGGAAAKVAVLGNDEVGKLHKELVNHAEGSHGILEAVAEVFEAFEGLVGKRYAPFEYVGSHDAEHVVIAMGSAAALVEEALVKSNDYRVGLIKVRLLRPWSAQHLVEALPESVRRVAVVDDLSASNGQQGQLFLDVTASFYSGAARARGGRIPGIVGGGFSGPLVGVSAVQGFLEAFVDGKVHFGFKVSGADAFRGLNEEEDDGIRRVIFWDVQSDATEGVASRVAEYVDRDGSDVVQSLVVRDDVRIEPVSATHLSFGADAGRQVAAGAVTGHADVVSVHNVSVLEGYDVVAGLKKGGVLLVNLPGAFGNRAAALAEVERLLPAAQKKAVVEKGVKVHVVDAGKVAANYTLFEGNPKEYVELVLVGAVLEVCKGVDGAVAVQRLRKGLEGSETSHNVLRTKIGALETGVKEVRAKVNVPAKWRDGEEEEEVKDVAVVPTRTVALKKVHQRSEEDDSEVAVRSVKRYAAALPVLFKEAYGVKKVLRPDVDEKTFVVTVTENRRLTPTTYERNVFHIEMDIAGTGLKYDIGEALGVYGHNETEAVRDFLKDYGVEASEVVEYEREGKKEYRTLEQVFVQVADVFGKPGKKFYQGLVPFATVMAEREKLGWLGSAEGAEDLEKLVEEETPTYADVLAMFPSARPPVDVLLKLIPDIKPRHYSISSSMNVHKTSVHLLVVLVDWKTSSGKLRTGQCTRYLHSLRPGQTLTVSVKPSVMKLPPSLAAPVIMSGLGTGMAPFRAFVEERAYQKSLGKHVGPMVLYFGARHRSEEYLYGEELEAYHADGVLTHLRLAFSRDQKEKVYIQHKIREDKKMLGEMMVEGGGAFYLCGPTWPVPDVKEALVGAVEGKVGDGEAFLEALKEEERYVLE
ncbi:hypothetical protein HDU97_008459, partial [Phlyctochytrium planicorne]